MTFVKKVKVKKTQGPDSGPFPSSSSNLDPLKNGVSFCKIDFDFLREAAEVGCPWRGRAYIYIYIYIYARTPPKVYILLRGLCFNILASV